MPDRISAMSMLCPLKQCKNSSALAADSIRFYELDQMADRFANFLQTKGVGWGDRVALLHPPCIEVIALFFAVWRIGASICPLSPRLPLLQREEALQKLKPKLFIDAFPIDCQVNTSTYPLLEPSLLIFTSGSSGNPKIATLSLKTLLTNALSSIEKFDLKCNDSWLLNLPLYHVGGIGILLRCVLAQAKISFNPKDPTITHISVVPTQLYRATPIYPQLRCLLIGGAPTASFPERLPCYLSYGLTEMGSVVAASFKPTSPNLVGFPLEHREIKITSDGEILVRGDCLFQGYWENGKPYLPLLEGGWFATGDLGFYGPQGLLITGRKDWQFISGGENIQPEEIEKHLLYFPGILDAAVIPRYDPEFGYRPIAYLACSNPLISIEKIRDFLLERLPRFKIPIAYFFLDELPKIGIKIDRKSLLRIDKKMFN